MSAVSGLCLPTPSHTTTKNLSAIERLRKRLNVYRNKQVTSLPKHHETVNQMNTTNTQQIKILHQRFLESNPKKGNKSSSGNKRELMKMEMKSPLMQNDLNTSPSDSSKRIKLESTTSEQQFMQSSNSPTEHKTSQDTTRYNVEAEISAALKQEDTVGEFDTKLFDLEGINAKSLLELMDDLPNNFLDTFDFDARQSSENGESTRNSTTPKTTGSLYEVSPLKANLLSSTSEYPGNTLQHDQHHTRPVEPSFKEEKKARMPNDPVATYPVHKGEISWSESIAFPTRQISNGEHYPRQQQYGLSRDMYGATNNRHMVQDVGNYSMMASSAGMWTAEAGTDWQMQPLQHQLYPATRGYSADQRGLAWSSGDTSMGYWQQGGVNPTHWSGVGVRQLDFQQTKNRGHPTMQYGTTQHYLQDQGPAWGQGTTYLPPWQAS